MSREHRDSFVFYHSFKEAINELADTDKLSIYEAISTYALYREEPKLEGITKVAWLLIRPQLDANWRKYEKGCRGGESGKLGGAPKGNKNAKKSDEKQPQNNPKTTPNVNVNDNENVNDNVFTTTTPSLSDIISFVESNTLSVDPNYFYDYYAAAGWMMGKRPMTDWQAALRNWDRISTKETTAPSTIKTNLQIQILNDL